MSETRPDLARYTLGVLTLVALIVASLWTLRPFLGATIWAAMLVVATWPALLWFQAKLWGKRSKAIPIKNRAHQVNTFYYILRHARQGAWIWDFRQEKQDAPSEPPPSPQPAPCGDCEPPQPPA